MQKWEYLEMRVEIRSDRKSVDKVEENGKEIYKYSKETPELKLTEHLKKLGEDGWEMINIFAPGSGWHWVYHFKRPVE